jgi:hypothetical protein
MDTAKHVASRKPKSTTAPKDNPFKPLVALTGAAIFGLVGVVIALLVTSHVGLEWPMRLVVAVQIALSLAILGGWMAASFVLDARDDLESPIPLTLPTQTAPPERVLAHGRHAA